MTCVGIHTCILLFRSAGSGSKRGPVERDQRENRTDYACPLHLPPLCIAPDIACGASRNPGPKRFRPGCITRKWTVRADVRLRESYLFQYTYANARILPLSSTGPSSAGNPAAPEPVPGPGPTYGRRRRRMCVLGRKPRRGPAGPEHGPFVIARGRSLRRRPRGNLAVPCSPHPRRGHGTGQGDGRDRIRMRPS